MRRPRSSIGTWRIGELQSVTVYAHVAGEGDLRARVSGLFDADVQVRLSDMDGVRASMNATDIERVNVHACW